MRIRHGDGRIKRQALPEPSNEPLLVGAIVALRDVSDGPQRTPTSGENAMTAGLEGSVAVASRPADTFDVAVRITATSRTVAGSNVEAAQALMQGLATPS